MIKPTPTENRQRLTQGFPCVFGRRAAAAALCVLACGHASMAQRPRQQTSANLSSSFASIANLPRLPEAPQLSSSSTSVLIAEYSQQTNLGGNLMSDEQGADEPTDRAIQQNGAAPAIRTSPLQRIGVGVNVGSLGIGGEVAIELSRRSNARLAGATFPYQGDFEQDGFTYTAHLNLANARAMYDWYPWANGFRISGGVMVYNGTDFHAVLNSQPGLQFSINDDDYISSVDDPIHGTASVSFRKVAPVFTLGWGNIVPRREGRRWSVPFEAGFAYQGYPKVQFNLSGSACGYDEDGDLGCQKIDQDSSFQSNVEAEKQTIQKDTNPLRFYPILSVGFGYRF